MKFYKNVLDDIKPGLNVLLVHVGYDNDELKAITVDHPHWGSKWSQKGAKGNQNGGKREPRGAKREPKVSQRATKMHQKVDLQKRSRK